MTTSQLRRGLCVRLPILAAAAVLAGGCASGQPAASAPPPSAAAQHVEEIELAQLVGAGPDPLQLVLQPAAVARGRRLQQRTEPGEHRPAAQRVGPAQEP